MRSGESAEIRDVTPGCSQTFSGIDGVLSVGSYLTDDVFLYRVNGRVREEAVELVDLEDCYGLDVVRVPAHVLRKQRLRVVVPT